MICLLFYQLQKILFITDLIIAQKTAIFYYHVAIDAICYAIAKHDQQNKIIKTIIAQSLVQIIARMAIHAEAVVVIVREEVSAFNAKKKYTWNYHVDMRAILNAG